MKPIRVWEMVSLGTEKGRGKSGTAKIVEVGKEIWITKFFERRSDSNTQGRVRKPGETNPPATDQPRGEKGRENEPECN